MPDAEPEGFAELAGAEASVVVSVGSDDRVAVGSEVEVSSSSGELERVGSLAEGLSLDSLVVCGRPFVVGAPVSYTHLTLPTTPYV